MAKRERGRLDLEAEVQRLQAEVQQLRRRLAEVEATRIRMPLTKRDQVIALLRRGNLSDRAIARQVGVSPTTVGKLRAEME